jgi:hypothetical protein
MRKAKQQSAEQDTMRPEYDLSSMVRVGERGRYHHAMRKGYTTIVHHKDGSKTVTQYRPLPGAVHLDPDVQAYFPDAEAVNMALRGLIALIPAKRRAVRKAKRRSAC